MRHERGQDSPSAAMHTIAYLASQSAAALPPCVQGIDDAGGMQMPGCDTQACTKRDIVW